jgi:hypothetical protein
LASLSSEVRAWLNGFADGNALVLNTPATAQFPATHYGGRAETKPLIST